MIDENVNDDFSLPVDDENDLAMVHGSVPRLNRKRYTIF